MAGLLNFHNVPLQRETYEAPLMVLEDLAAGPDPEETCIDAVGILDRWNPSGIMKGDFCEITAAILEAAGQVDKAEEALKEAYPDGLKYKDYPAAVELALSFFRGL